MKHLRNRPHTKVLLVIFLSVFMHSVHAQVKTEDKPSEYHINGNASVTNNGFSFIPSFSLGKPAAIFNLSVGGERFSFDPQFRFDLDGIKPWSFIFIWRYKLIQTDKFVLMPGIHLPALAFTEEIIETEELTKTRSVPVRFITPELTANYKLSDKISLGVYYIYGLGLEKEDQSKHTHYLSLRSGFNRLQLFGAFHLSWNPQLYYLVIDGTGGFYAAQTLSLGHEKVPLSISSTMNKVLKTDLSTKDFDWNISLVYTFRNQLVKK